MQYIQTKERTYIQGRLVIDHLTVVDLVPLPSSKCGAEVDLVLIYVQTSFALLWKLSSKNTYEHKCQIIFITKLFKR